MEDKIINDIKKIYPDYDIKVGASVFRSDVFRVYLEKDGVKKSILYNPEEEKIFSNEIKGLYQIVRYFGNAFTLHGYNVNDVIRSFVAITNVDSGQVLPVAFDLDKRNFIMIPIANNGLIDDNMMIETIKEDDLSIGLSPFFYEDIVGLGNIYSIMMYLGIEDGFDITEKLFDYNKERLEELKEKTLERLRNKNRNK
jgi:hypothetical protein